MVSLYVQEYNDTQANYFNARNGFFRQTPGMSPKFAIATAGIVFLAARAVSQETPFPLADIVAEARQMAASFHTVPSGMGRADYLKTSEGIVVYFQHFQNPDGRIIDPFLRREVQYSTPCYAFFTFPCMLAYETLRDRVSSERRVRWERDIRAIVPEHVYQDLPSRHEPHNWAVVALAGEFLRQHDGFGDASFADKALALQMKHFTANGQYMDPEVPMAYDQFPRCFLATMIERGYGGEYSGALSNLMDRAAWTSFRNGYFEMIEGKASGNRVVSTLTPSARE
jgi:hypothetical protein